jgi:hypothetical protein
MRALVATVFVCALLVVGARPAHALPFRQNRFGVPRLALTMGFDWRSGMASDHRHVLVAQMRVPTALRHQQMLTAGASMIPKAPTALYIMAYDRLSSTVLRVVQPKRDLSVDGTTGYVRTVQAGPMFSRGALGALVTFETSPRY